MDQELQPMQTNTQSNTKTEYKMLHAILSILFFLLVPGIVSISHGDAWVLEDGTMESGRITQMIDGQATLITAQGSKTVEIAKLKQFMVSREEDGAYAKTLETMQTLQSDQLLMNQRIDNLARLIESLSAQISNVQVSQQVQSNQIIQRTQEQTPWQRLAVNNVQISKAGGRSIISGQVMNQSGAPLYSVRVNVSIYGRTGQLGNLGGIKSEAVAVTPTNLASGGVGTFRADFDSKLVFDNYDVVPTGALQERYRYDPQGDAQMNFPSN